MHDYLEILKCAALFNGTNPDEIASVLKCLEAEPKNISKNDALLLAGDKPTSVGILLSGKLHIVRDDYDGNHVLLSDISPGEIFAETLCCANVPESPVSVFAHTDSVVLLLNFPRLLHTCSHACPFHAKLVDNMLRIVAEKNLLLQSRLEILSLKSIRMKVLRYLENLSQKQKTEGEIVVPFNREQLADFLCVERSALSHELARMKDEGLIDYRKNIFVLL